MGLVLGLTIGYVQGRLLQLSFSNAFTWSLANGLCLAGIFLVDEVGSVFLDFELGQTWIIVQTMIFAVAGAFAGFWQSKIEHYSWHWVVSSAAAWGAAILVTQILYEILPQHDMWGLVTLIAAVLAGGLTLGVISGWGAYRNFSRSFS